VDAIERDIAGQLGIDPDDPKIEHAVDLFGADRALLDDLVRLRNAKGLSQQLVAERMNRDRTSVTRFERVDSNPRLSTIRRYALAVGARITHRVQDMDGASSADRLTFAYKRLPGPIGQQWQVTTVDSFPPARQPITGHIARVELSPVPLDDYARMTQSPLPVPLAEAAARS